VLWFDVGVLVPFVDQVACLLGDLVENVVHVLSAQNRRHLFTNDTCSGVSHEVAMISQLYPFTGSGKSWYAFF
jgi:hypothetical protein